MSGEFELEIHCVCETATEAEGGGGMVYELHGRNALTDPAPVVYVDGMEPLPGVWTFDPGDAETCARITFVIAPGDVKVECTYSWLLEPGPGEEPTVYEFERAVNAAAQIDANGRRMVTESCNRVTGWSGALVWQYATQGLWDDIRRLAEGTRTTFDIVRASLEPPFDRIENLYVTGYPKFGETAGVPGRTGVAIGVVQIETD